MLRLPHRSRSALIAAFAVLAAGASFPGAAGADTFRVQSTTDTVDAGLVDGLLRDAYAKAQPGDSLAYVGVGTGKALDNARAGLADVVITHAPSLEAQFVSDGFSLEPLGRAIFYSDYVLVGPASDPAGVLSSAPQDAVTAFEKIAAAGAAGAATFVSRADNSGTNVQEQTMWALTSDAVTKQPASNGAGAAARKEPGSGGTYPAWYERTNKGQAANLQTTDACTPTGANPNGGCYTLVDRGTYNRLVATGTLTKLQILGQRNAAAARGGENLLINPFSAYVVNPDKIPTDPKPNVAAGQRFLDFLTSPSFQAALESFPSAADPAFRGDAFPKLEATVPTTASAKSTLSIGVTASDRLPGGATLDGLPLQLEGSTDNGGSWQAIGGPVTTDASARATLSAPISTTTQYRVTTLRYRKFSPSTSQTLGPVVVPAEPISAPTKDTVAPRASALTLTARRVSVRVSEGATVKITVARQRTVKIKGKLRHRYTTVTSTTIKAKAAGTLTRRLARLRAGTYRVSVVSTDAAGNRSTTSRLVKLKGSTR